MINAEGRFCWSGWRRWVGKYLMGVWTEMSMEIGRIDYIMGDVEVREQVERMKVDDNVESDHQALVIQIKVREIRKWGVRGEERKGKGI